MSSGRRPRPRDSNSPSGCPDRPVEQRVDADAVKQALINLIDNAIKYSGEDRRSKSGSETAGDGDPRPRPRHRHRSRGPWSGSSRNSIGRKTPAASGPRAPGWD